MVVDLGNIVTKMCCSGAKNIILGEKEWIHKAEEGSLEGTGVQNRILVTKNKKVDAED